MNLTSTWGGILGSRFLDTVTQFHWFNISCLQNHNCFRILINIICRHRYSPLPVGDVFGDGLVSSFYFLNSNFDSILKPAAHCTSQKRLCLSFLQHSSRAEIFLNDGLTDGIFLHTFHHFSHQNIVTFRPHTHFSSLVTITKYYSKNTEKVLNVISLKRIVMCQSQWR